MIDEKKQIEEMARTIRPILENRTDIGYIPDLDKPIAKELIKHYQPKIPEGAVVLTGEEFDVLTLSSNKINEFNGNLILENQILKDKLKKARKETAREIIKILIPPCEVCDEDWHKGCLCLRATIAEKIAKQYGVSEEEL